MPATLLAAVEAMPIPAYVLDRYWCRRAWNAAAAELFASRIRALSLGDAA